MSRHPCLVLLLVTAFSVLGYDGAACTAPELSNQEVKKIVDRERTVRHDLAQPFPKYRWDVKKQGCYYVYIEVGLPEAPEYSQSFTLNQRGVIVDAAPAGMHCPEQVLTEAELAQIVGKARDTRKDLPAPLPKTRTRVERLRCMYQYFEYAVPESRGNFLVFTIDPFGELIGVYRSKPY